MSHRLAAPRVTQPTGCSTEVPRAVGSLPERGGVHPDHRPLAAPSSFGRPLRRSRNDLSSVWAAWDDLGVQDESRFTKRPPNLQGRSSGARGRPRRKRRCPLPHRDRAGGCGCLAGARRGSRTTRLWGRGVLCGGRAARHLRATGRPCDAIGNAGHSSDDWSRSGRILFRHHWRDDSAILISRRLRPRCPG
jgi:hypothetical protein